LRDLAAERTGVGKRALDRKLKAALGQQAEDRAAEERQARAAALNSVNMVPDIGSFHRTRLARIIAHVKRKKSRNQSIAEPNNRESNGCVS
jgi:hypothetical protein